MNIQSTEDTHSWAKFLTLANAARVRNAGFDLPMAPVRTVATGKKGIKKGKINQTIRPGSFYRTHETKKNKIILGKRFDAYG